MIPLRGRPAPAKEAEPQPGASIGGYRLGRLLARGSSGSLHVAHGPGDAPPRAIKLLRTPLQASPDACREAHDRFLREAELLGRLRHPAIVDVHAAGIEGGIAYLVTSLLPGGDLRRYVRPARRLPEPLLLGLGADAADALAHAHGLGMVHRDVKPANLVFDPASRRVWLTDFGAARLHDAERTRTGLIVGTPSFMPPEQLAGAAPDAAGDVYALGVTLFQLLTGRLPYEGDTMGSLLQAIARGEALPLQSLRPDLPAALAELLSRVLHRDPAARPRAATLTGPLRTWADSLR